MLLHPGPRLLKSGLDAVRLGDADRLAAKAFGDLDVIHAVAVALRSIRPVETPAWLSERRPVAREIGAVPLFPDKRSIPYNGATPNHGEHGPARDLKALIGRVVRAIAQKIMRNHDLLRWIPDDDVRIGSNRNRALARVKPVGLAWLVEVSATKRLRSMRPFTTPSENRIGSRAAIPGDPFGTQWKLVRALGVSLPWSSYRNGQWSDENTEKHPCAAPPSRPLGWLRRGVAGSTGLGPLHVEPLKILRGQDKVLRAGLAMDLQTLGLRAPDRHRLSV